MPASITPELIASAITTLFFAVAGVGIYSKTEVPKIEGAFKVERAGGLDGAVQLEGIAQALEALVAANKDS